MRLHHDFVWATLVHFSTNLWHDIGNTRCDGSAIWKSPASEKLRFDKELWEKYLQSLKDCGSNAIVIDLGDAMVYDSHPEIAVEGAFTKEEMRALAMDPNNRVLVRLTVDDIESTTNIMDNLFLKERRAVRKEMIANMDISIDDIDN